MVVSLVSKYVLCLLQDHMTWRLQSYEGRIPEIPTKDDSNQCRCIVYAVDLAFM